MTDKERIERLLQTLMHVKNCLGFLKQIPQDESLEPAIDDIASAIEVAIQANADQINLDL